MKININEINFTIKNADEVGKHPNLLAYATVTFKEENGEHLAITGFTVWKSKFSGYNVEPPGKIKFKYCCGSLLRRIKQEIIKQYEYEKIPVVEE